MTFQKAADAFPTWSPDGRTVYFTSQRDGQRPIYRKAADGSGEAERLLEAKYALIPLSVSPDGKILLYNETHPETKQDLWTLPLEKDAKPQPFAFDVSGDGNHFVLIQNLGGEANAASRGPTLVRFTFHWFEELKQRLKANR